MLSSLPIATEDGQEDVAGEDIADHTSDDERPPEGDALSCDDGLSLCSGWCVDLQSDKRNCGRCGNACPDAEGAEGQCLNGDCVLQCLEGRWDIDGIPGCEYACTFTSSTETCDGEDNDCNGTRDDPFACVRGTEVACTTSCGSEGTGTCTDGCAIPSSALCALPDETCNGVDDDCDGYCDEGFDCCAGDTTDCTTWCDSTGSSICSDSCRWGPCLLPAETCNRQDDDCDGSVDEDFECVYTGMNRSCTTECGINGTEMCTIECVWTGCCASDEVTLDGSCSNGCDDDCNGLVDDC